MEDTYVQSIKLAIVATTGLSKDALHIYIGMAALFATAAILRKPLRSFAPWLVVLFIALLGELIDIIDEIIHIGYWNWAISAYDIANTLFWPTVICLFVRHVSFLWAAHEP